MTVALSKKCVSLLVIAFALCLPAIFLACGADEASDEGATGATQGPVSSESTPDMAAQTASTGGDAATAVTPEAGSSTIDSTDREVLIALYNATGGAGWVANNNWLSEEPLGDWDGVGLDAGGRVAALRLSDNNMTGEIPPELGNLSNLLRLLLNDNDLSGEIPPELVDLSKLWELDISDNNLTGEIPTGLGDLSELVQLRLSGNELSGCVPSSLDGQLFMPNSDLGLLNFC